MKRNLPVTQHEIDYADSDVFVTRTDPKGIITYANDAFVKISGFSREELVGKNHNMVRHPDMPEWAFADLWKTVKSGRPWRGLVKNRAKNGDCYWVRATVSPIQDNGQTTGYLSLRKKPSRAEVAHAEQLYKSASAPSRKWSPVFWFQNFSLERKLQILLQPVLLLLSSGALWAFYLFLKPLVADQGKLFTSVLWLVAGQVGLQVVLYALIAWVAHAYVTKPFREIREHLCGLINGNMLGQVKIDGRDEMGEIQCLVQSAKVLLGSVVEQISTATKQIDARASLLDSNMSRMEDGSHAQSSAASQMAAAVEQMSVNVDQVSENTEDVRSISEQSKSLADDGGKIVTQVVQDMSGIAEVVVNSANTIQELGRKSEQIQGIVRAIKEIADQTNLLALNAAIEAARAGEHGRGFAVVADEVRSLAEKTRQSTQQIAQMTEEINSSTNHAVTEVSAAVEMVKSGSQLAEKAGGAIIEINHGALKVLNGVNDIAASMKEQSLASRNIAVNVEKVAQMSEQAGMTVREVSESVRQLKALSQSLETSVGHFRI
jgi:aerotaxis receptor